MTYHTLSQVGHEARYPAGSSSLGNHGRRILGEEFGFEQSPLQVCVVQSTALRYVWHFHGESSGLIFRQIPLERQLWSWMLMSRRRWLCGGGARHGHRRLFSGRLFTSIRHRVLFSITYQHTIIITITIL